MSYYDFKITEVGFSNSLSCEVGFSYFHECGVGLSNLPYINTLKSKPLSVKQLDNYILLKLILAADPGGRWKVAPCYVAYARDCQFVMYIYA